MGYFRLSTEVKVAFLDIWKQLQKEGKENTYSACIKYTCRTGKRCDQLEVCVFEGQGGKYTKWTNFCALGLGIKNKGEMAKMVAELWQVTDSSALFSSSDLHASFLGHGASFAFFKGAAGRLGGARLPGKVGGSRGAERTPARETGRIRGRSGVTAAGEGAPGSRGPPGSPGLLSRSPWHSGGGRIGGLFAAGSTSRSPLRFRSTAQGRSLSRTPWPNFDSK